MLAAGELCDDPKFDGHRSTSDAGAQLKRREVTKRVSEEMEAYFANYGAGGVNEFETLEEFTSLQAVFDEAFAEYMAICVPPDLDLSQLGN